MKLLPADDVGEAQLIGCCIRSAEEWLKAMRSIRAEHFITPVYRRVWEWAATRIRESRDLDTGMIPQSVARTEDDRAALTFADECVSGPANAPEYADRVRSSYVKRELILSAKATLEMCETDGLSGRECLEWMQRQVFNLASHSDGPAQAHLWRDVVQEVLSHMANKDAIPDGILSGIDDLDGVTGGLKPGQLVILAGRTGNGKTVLATQLAWNAATAQNRPTMFVSLEMARTSVAHRILAGKSGISLRRIEQPRYLDKADFERICDAANPDYDAPLWFVDASRGMTASRIASLSRFHKMQNGLDLLVVDYLGLLDRSDVQRKGIATAYEFGEVTRMMKILAQELAVPVVLLVQVSRTVDHREDPVPKLADLRDSGSIEADADLVMFTVLHEKYTKNPSDAGRASIIVAKNRQGRCTTIPAVWLPQEWAFQSATRGNEP